MSVEVPGFGPLTEIGRGGFGIVYVAEDEAHGRTVAVKVLRNALDPDGQARFERECRAAGSLSGHPNIVSIHASGVTPEGDPYLVMDHLGGGSLADRVARLGPLAPSDAIALGVGLSGALAAAHGAGIVHRDVKPENVLYSSFDVPQLVDFGIARMASEFETRSSSISASIAHAPPEVLAGATASPAADVYSLASVLHFALAGSAPFTSEPEESLAPLIVRISAAPPPDLRLLGVPDALAEVVERGLAKDPADRPASAAELGEALRAAARSLGETPPAMALTSPVVVPVGDAEPADVDPHAVTAPDLTTQPVGAGGASRRRRARVAALVLVAVAAVVAGLLVVGGDEGDGDDGVAAGATTTTAGAATPQVVQEPVEQAGLRVDRVFAVADGDGIGSTVELTNTTDETVKRVWFEVIPKELASRVADVSFSRRPTGVVVDDPVVYWVLTLDPGASQVLTWSTPIPTMGAPTEAYLRRVVRLHGAAVAAAGDAITYATAALEADTGAEAVVPEVTTPVDPGGGEPGEDGGTDGGSGIDPGDGGSTDPGGTPGDGGGVAETTVGPVATTATTVAPTTTTTRPAAPGRPTGVVVRNPSGTRQSVAVSLSWNAPGGPVTRYRIRHQQWYFAGCGASRTSSAVVDDGAATSTSAQRSTATEQGCSWIVWQVAAENAGGLGPWVTATGIVPNVRNLDAAYHLVRAVGGKAVHGADQQCGVPATFGCGTNPAAGTSIAAGTTVAVAQQPE